MLLELGSQGSNLALALLHLGLQLPHGGLGNGAQLMVIDDDCGDATIKKGQQDMEVKKRQQDMGVSKRWTWQALIFAA